VLVDKLGINLITGMKGSGKSYLAKRLLSKLIDQNILTVVFDLNAEYLDLRKTTFQEKTGAYFEMTGFEKSSSMKSISSGSRNSSITQTQSLRKIFEMTKSHTSSAAISLN